MTDQNVEQPINEENVPEPPQQEAPPTPPPPQVFRVMIADLHSGKVAEIPAKTMGEAIDQYKRVNAAARVDRPFTLLNDLHWVATHTFRGGKIRVVSITNGEKVYARSQGVQRLNNERSTSANNEHPALTPVPALS